MTFRNQDVEINAGDDQEFDFTTYQADGVTVQDISGTTGQGMQVFKNEGDETLIVGATCSVILASAGTWKARFTAAQTQPLEGLYFYVAYIVDVSGLRNTVATGKFFVHDSA
jgi:hypothetical protein